MNSAIIHPLRRLGAFSDSHVWHLECDGLQVRLSDGKKQTDIDVCQEPWRIGLNNREIVIDMMRFSADSAGIQAIAGMLEAIRQLPTEKPTTVRAESKTTADSSTASTASVSLCKNTYAQKLGAVGGMVGIIVMFVFPARGGLIGSAIIGAVCGMSGYGVGLATGSFCDALYAPPPETHTNRTRMSVGSVVLGIIGLVAWLLPIVGVPVAVVGLVLGGKGASSSSRNTALVGMGLSLVCLLFAVGNGLLGAAINMLQANR